MKGKPTISEMRRAIQLNRNVLMESHREGGVVRDARIRREIEVLDAADELLRRIALIRKAIQ
jgi:hypothetical protein